MRVIAGTARGRRLAGPPAGAATRPTSDKVREALFNVVGPLVRDARVLDLFAGTGALGIEALSRGAAHATFVDADRGLCRTIAKNLEATGLAARAAVVCRDVRRAGGALRGAGGDAAPFDLVLIDPPYGLGLEREALALLAATPGLLAPGALVVLEHASRDGVPALPAGAQAVLTHERSKPYGDTTLTYYRAGGETEQASGASATAAGERDAQAHVHTAATPGEQPASAPDLPRSPMTRTAIYPGSFDPLTNGHHDVIKRSLVLFDRLVIAVAPNVRKQPLFDVAERTALIREVVGDDPRIEIDTFEGLLVEYATRKGAVAVVRGLRAVADFEYEFAMASMNRRLAPDVETVFLMTHESNFYVSSNLVKEVAALGGDIDAFVPPTVAVQLRARLAARARAGR